MNGSRWQVRWTPSVLLVGFTLLFHLGILANPGFYSHDEWEKFDQLRASGFWGAARGYLLPHAGTDFGHPVRPIGFLQQLASAHWMVAAPILPHLFDVLLHALVSVVILLALRDAGATPGLALLVALGFSASPLTTMATGWVGASFDQWYVLFACLAGWAGWRAATLGMTWRRAVALLAAASAAILSKEAAVMLPAALALLMALAWLERSSGGRFHPGAAAAAVLLAALPVLAYLLFRLPALQASFAGGAPAAYAPSLGHVWRNMLGYFAFPFMPHGGDFPPVSPWYAPRILLGVGLHALLVAGVVAYGSARRALVYLLAYAAFLVPVLPLARPWGHYLHGAAPAMALATGFVLAAAWRARRWPALAVAAVGLGVMTANAALIQVRLYQDGRCQGNFLTSLESRLAQDPAGTVVIDVAPGARFWVGTRAIHDRGPPFSDAAGQPRAAFGAAQVSGAVRLTMGADCLLR